MVAAAAVIANPWAGKGFVEDLRPVILEAAPGLADVLVPMLLDELGGAPKLEAYGKAAVVGLDGEIEHASGFIHTLRFGNCFREAVGGTSYLSFTNKRGPAGCSIQIPMMHKTDEGFRSHYLTIEFAIADAPLPDGDRCGSGRRRQRPRPSADRQPLSRHGGNVQGEGRRHSLTGAVRGAELATPREAHFLDPRAQEV
jgi:hypothetical protein